MSPNIEQVLDAALALPDGDRAELVEALIASFEPSDQPAFDESWRDVIQRRSAELRSGQVTPVPWSEVKDRARGKARG
jgi:putative addiction module component (TIGR02574 family)